jgi:hypothetical protein
MRTLGREAMDCSRKQALDENTLHFKFLREPQFKTAIING